MKILVTGGYGFIGSQLCEKLIQEKHDVFVIDDLSSGLARNLTLPHVFYRRNIADQECEAIFQNNNLDIVIHLAAKVDVAESAKAPYEDCQSNILGLVNMLRLSHQYKVKKFLFISSTAVYGDSAELTLSEASPLKPLSLYSINKANGEAYCRIWQEQYGLETVILRLSNVYGPRQGSFGEAGVISSFLKQIAAGQKLVIHGDGQQCRDYLYVDDAVMAIYWAAVKIVRQPVINIVSRQSHNLLEVVKLLGKHYDLPGLTHEKYRTFDICRASFDNSAAKEQLGWTPRYTLEEGLEKTCLWQAEQALLAPEKAPSPPSFLSVYRPYLENATLFALMACLSFFNLHGGLLDFRLGMDYNYIYIAVMGLLYGKQQSMPATALSVLLFCYSMTAKGADLVTLLYQVQYLTHLAVYLALGVITGYVTDRRRHILADKENELERIADKHRFLEKMHLECVQVKDVLYNQIVNSDDSIGKIYSIIKDLDSLAPEDIYTSSIDVLQRIMRCGSVDIYTVNADSSFWRIKVRAKDDAPYLENSIRVADSPYAQKVMQTKGVFVNRHFAGPSMAAAIRYQNKTIAIVQLYNLPFESMTLHQSNLLRVTALLIADALGKAHSYELSSSEKQQVSGTQLLLPDAFAKLQQEMTKRSLKHNQPCTLLRLRDKREDLVALYHSLANVIRAEDYAGLDPSGHVLLLLQNVTREMLPVVQERLAQKGFHTIEMAGA
ncbi:NAD-dependent epimerase/dehydratase family protein [Azotosporobacter soli]|uniref:NAD-dependent epimerase/dehydratase family protein n=1 Tax=Azotosporobacter soli TaxID=3055040 RepID=UPI0031FF2C91